jgi:hypothetical protein
MMGQIIQVCGTSGSGKSHAVRALVSMAASSERQHVEGRRLPIGYVLRVPEVTEEIYVLGSYENPTGGCDTISSMDLIDDILRREWRGGRSVVLEGLLVRNFVRGLPLYREVGSALHVFLLTTPLEQCYASIRQRQEARGVYGRGTPKNTANDQRSHDSYARRMREAGADVRRVSREELLPAMLRELKNI